MTLQIDVAASRIAKDFSELVRTGALTLGGAGAGKLGRAGARLLKGKRVTVPEVPPEAPPPPPEVPPPPPEVPPVEPPVEPPPVERTPVPGGDLAVHEAAGGHTIAEHVGRTTEQLATRLVDEPKIPAASTFPNIATAERATADALQARSAEIASWLSTSAKRLVLKVPLLYDVGISLARGATTPVNVRSVLIVLQRDASFPSGYRIITAYPVP